MTILKATSLLTLLLLVINTSSLHAQTFEKTFRTQVSNFLNQLDQSQQKECLQPMDLKKRWHKQYTGGKREGIQIKKLNPQQKKTLQTTLKLVLSDYGWKMAETVAQQDGQQGLDKYYIACFGDPRKADQPFAFRLCEHHLTIVHLVIKADKISEFGPILLGANPPLLWEKDEALLMQAWQKLDNKNKIESGSGISSKLMEAEKGILFNKLNTDAQAIIKQAWQHRISIFTPAIKTRLNTLQKARGGWEKSRIAYYNQAPEKRCKDGGKWDFKCALPGMVWDFEASRGHIHMSLCIHPLDQK